MRSCFQFSFFFRMASSVFGQFLTLSSLRALSRSRRVSVAVGASGRIAAHVRALREGDDTSKAVARRVLGYLAGRPGNRVLIAEAGGIPPLVDFLRDGSAEAKVQAAWALRNLSSDYAAKVLIAEAGGIPPLVDLVRDGSAEASTYARTLDNLAGQRRQQCRDRRGRRHPPLVELLRDGGAEAKQFAASALCALSRNNDAIAIAIALTVGFDAVVKLARDGNVRLNSYFMVANARPGARRKAALPVLRKCLPSTIPDDIAKAIAAALGP
ncbi:hypothetical protein JL721_1852 [Aureococcus anophagefferens]|nr:hypothetical protein JL721_1852 [Aureococcus anophagefferens]